MTDTILSDRAALLRRILETPEDDAPRLIYADILEENGEDTLAQFIRWQISHPKDHAICLCFQSQKFYGKHCNLCHMLAVQDLSKKFGGDVPFVVHRGFISEIRLTCEQFMQPSQECSRCTAQGVHWWDTRPNGPQRCETCNGSGKLPSLTERIFSEHPVTRVVLTDRKNPSFSNDGFYWLTGNSKNRDDEIPHVIAKFFQRRDRAYKRFETRDAALDALSSACCRYGRSLVGLGDFNE